MDIDQTEEDLVRLVTARFMPGRFKGRQQLEWQAGRGDLVALARLEMQLGLADKSALRQAYERQLNARLQGVLPAGPAGSMAKLINLPLGKRLPLLLGLIARHENVSRYLHHLVPPEDIENIQRKQKNRLWRAYDATDTYWTRENLSTFERLAQRRLQEALAKTARARRYYTVQAQAVPIGQERVETKTFPGWLRRRVGRGWGRSSQSEDYFDPKAWSRNIWYVSPTLLSPETRALQARNAKHVYLTPEKRVRWGRGRKLVTEVLNTEALRSNTQTALPWRKETPRWIVRG
jgi:hypothetical protein